MLQLMHEDCSLTLPSLSIAIYLFIQLSELGHRGENENAQASKQQQMIRTPSLSIILRVKYPTAPDTAGHINWMMQAYFIAINSGIGFPVVEYQGAG